MDITKELRKLSRANSNHNAMIGVALIGGLAVGAALAVLFAPKKGKDLRSGISGAGLKFSGTLTELMDALKAKFSGTEIPEEDHDDLQTQHREHAAPVKKPKSDIKEILHAAHRSN